MVEYISPATLNQRLNDALDDIAIRRTERLVTTILIGIEGYSQQLVPVMTSNLINSKFRRVTPTATGYRGESGYGAEYAAAVHEAPGALLGAAQPRYPRDQGWGNVWDSTGEPQFLQKAIDTFVERDLTTVIRSIMRV